MIRLFNHYLSVRLLLLTTLEAVVLFKSMMIGLELGTVDASALDPFVEAGLFMLVMLAAMSALGLYQTHREPFRRTVQRLLIAYGLSLLLLGATLLLIAPDPVGLRMIAWGSLVALAAVFVVRTVFFRLTDLGLPKRRVLVLGNGMEAESVIRYLHSESLRRSVRFAGLYPVMTERDEWGRPHTLNHAALERTVAELGVSEIVVAVRERRGGVLPLRQLLNCKLRGVSVMDLPSFYEREQGILTVDSLRASWMIFGGGFRQGVARDVVKRVFDALVALALIVATLPLVIVAMVAIAVESGFPVLYFQERVGQGGRRFRIIKLRTMRQDAEADGRPRWARVGDSRVTRVGALLRLSRIDELPQLWNVLRGEMSFVGPRPERPFFVDTLRSSIPFYDVRHSVKPGVTGWAQVRYTYTASVEDTMVKLQYDLYYVKNHSLFLDLMILVDTIQVILLGKGAR